MQATKKPSDNNLGPATTVVRRRRVPPTKDPLSITSLFSFDSRRRSKLEKYINSRLIRPQVAFSMRLRARAHSWGAGRLALRRLPVGKPEARSGPDRSGRPELEGRPVPPPPVVRAESHACRIGS